MEGTHNIAYSWPVGRLSLNMDDIDRLAETSTSSTCSTSTSRGCWSVAHKEGEGLQRDRPNGRLCQGKTWTKLKANIRTGGSPKGQDRPSVSKSLGLLNADHEKAGEDKVMVVAAGRRV